MHSISDLTTFCRKTTGDVPPKLVVCIHSLSSFTVRHLFVGRVYHSRRIEDVSLRALLVGFYRPFLIKASYIRVGA